MRFHMREAKRSATKTKSKSATSTISQPARTAILTKTVNPSVDPGSKEQIMTRTADPIGALVSENHRSGPVSRPEMRSDPSPARTRHALRDPSEMPADSESLGGKLHIAKEDFPDGRDLIWCAASVYGQPQPDNVMARERRGWEPVWGSDFEGRFKHFVPSGGKMDEPIVKDGLMLMARDLRWSMKAKAEEARKAAAPVLAQAQQLQRGQVDGVAFPGRALNVSGRQGLSKSVEPLDAAAIRETGR
jgi:hypothetical protein